MLVRQILAMKGGGEVETIPAATGIADAVRMLSEKRIGALVVSDDGKTPLGILSERDVVRELGRRGQGVLDENVSDLMTHDLIGCTSDESADQVLSKMTDGRFRHMPVMDGTQMIGLISIGDVVKARLSELAMEKDALEGMIKGF
ncbi:CBS domain-containing protein [Alphaproteobacteria bacterium GH1-50]|uniref:CBS domain-containing protein n=1 Tax=Kangsaoukella pontilimi TaxID=2691042 RepID=A0A7C9MZQ7_9RHOB|nr:CBS domain-containing protein [Kangsaoukella pontilimi]MXQ07678.1 CBS domain-containing protein [Kangsaoukella pontilimi]